MTISSTGPIIMPAPVSGDKSTNRQSSDKRPKSVPFEAHVLIKKRLRKTERELIQLRKKEKAHLGKNEQSVIVEKKLRTKIENIRKENTHLTEKIIMLKNENLKLTHEIGEFKQKTQVIQNLQDKLDYFQHMYEEEKRRHEQTQSQVSKLNHNHIDEEHVLSIIHRMDEFIDGDIAERGELIRQLDRIRDRAVQSIRILEQEKAVNLGLLKSKQINRKIAERAALFVDVQNMFYAARQQFNGRLDFQRLLARVAVDRKLFKAIAYIVETPDIDQTHFITLLTKSGYEVKSKELRTRGDGSAKGNWDMEMAMDIISLLPKLDVMILVSGDGDFVPLVQKIKSESRVKCEIYGFEHNTAIDLKEIADKFQAIGRDLLLDTASEEN